MARRTRRIASPICTPPCPHSPFIYSGSVFQDKYVPINLPPHLLPYILPKTPLNFPLYSMEEVSNSSSSSSNKRLRSEPEESPEAKRIRADVLDIFANDDDETDSGDDGSAVEDLACVMQSLQEEISVSLPATMPTEETVELPDLDYLLEASDDELGLPPTGTVPSPAADVGGYGQNWAFNDEFRSGFFDDLDFSNLPEEAGGGGADMFNDSLFEYDVFSGVPDFFDTTWQSESLRTV